MTRDEACRELGMSASGTRAEAIAQFHLLAHQHHPDHGGDPERFRTLLDAYQLIRAVPDPSAHCPACHGSGHSIYVYGLHTMALSCMACDGTGERRIAQ